MEDERTPAIRFRRFSDPWRQQRVGDIVSDIQRPASIKDEELYQLVTVKRRNEGVVSRGLLKGKDILVKNYFEVRAGDYIVSKRQVIHGGNGLVPENLDKSVVSNEYMVVVSNDAISAKFWTLISKRREMYKMFFLSSYGVDVEKMVFNVEDWKRRFLIIPATSEQDQINELHDQLDHLIDLHQRKYEKLQNLKSAMLEKMFPKHGADVPEIRFLGFTEPLEQRMFADMVTRNSAMAVCSSELPSIEYEDIVSGQGILNKNIREKQIIKTGIQFEPGDVLFGKLRPYLKNWILSDLSGVAVGDFWVLHPSETDSRYLYYLIQTPDFQTTANQSTGTKMPRSDWNLVSNTKFLLPRDVTEQRKIGATFQTIDNLINLHQNELEKLRSIKKCMLERMFV